MAQYEAPVKNSGLNDPEEADNMAQLGERLVQHLGVEDAIRTCHENSWYGVLRFIENRQNDGIYI